MLMSDDKQREADETIQQDTAGEPSEDTVDTGQTAASGSDDAAPAEESPPPSGNGNGRGIAILALLISLLLALALAVGGWFLWERQQQLLAEQENLALQDNVADAAELAELRESVSSELDEIRDSAVSRADRLEGRVENLASEHQGHVQTLARAAELMEGVRERQALVDDRMERLQVLTEAKRQEWVRSEVDYLFNLARYRATLHRDPDGALEALREADRLLRDMSDDTVDERRAVRDAVDALLEVRMPDRAAAAASIRDVIAAMDDFAVHQPDTRLEPQAMGRQRDAQLDSAEGWRRAGQRAWMQFRESLSSLVVVHRGEPARPLMAAEEEWFLRENLRLNLQTARVALLEGEEQTWQDSLAEADDWLERYFQQGDAVTAARETLQELREMSLTAELPDLDALLPSLSAAESDEEDDS